jgi:Ca2+-transporting ATPase
MRRPAPRDRIGSPPPAAAGLAEAEVAARRARWGTNALVETAGSGLAEVAADTARDPMLWFLLATGVLYAALGQRTEAAVLFVSIAPLAAMDAVLHLRTRASTRSLGRLLASTARVRRGGAVVTVPAAELVPGDAVLLGPGEPVPVDGVMVEADGLQVDESALTGEAWPVRKQALTAFPVGEAPLVEEVAWVLAGTRSLTGSGTIRAVYTGGDTLYSEIVRAAAAPGVRTPLQLAIAQLVRVLLIVAAVLCVTVAGTRLAQGHGWVDALVGAATLAIAALPEEFPVVFTVFLGVGVVRLARRRALVRRAVTVENIGRATVICSDKTGTVTEGRLSLAHVLPEPGVPAGDLLRAAAAASRAESSDPVDDAILAAAAAAGVARPAPLHCVPFTEDRRRETAFLLGEVVAKGAPETVAGLCRREAPAEVAVLSDEAHKVLAVARRRGPVTPGAAPGAAPGDPPEEPTDGWELLGLLAFEDRVREGVADAVARCRAAGIRVILVTGDHARTAAAVAREIGLSPEPRVVEGEALADWLVNGDPLGVDVVARALPAQKLALVRALQRRGEVVAVTGDGVNDVPALQAADIGVAMGERGTKAAREAAHIVLLNDAFSTIVDAVEEGARLYGNLRASFTYLLALHLPVFLTAAIVPLAGLPLLYEPVHIVWIESLIHPTALLAFSAASAGRAARGHASQLFSRPELVRIVASGLLLAVIAGALFARALGPDGGVEHARALALAVITLGSAAFALALGAGRTGVGRLIVAASVASTALFTGVPAVAAILHLHPLDPDDAALALVGAFVAAAPLWVRAPGGATLALRAPATPDLLPPTPSPARTPRG